MGRPRRIYPPPKQTFIRPAVAIAAAVTRQRSHQAPMGYSGPTILAPTSAWWEGRRFTTSGAACEASYVDLDGLSASQRCRRRAVRQREGGLRWKWVESS